MSRKTGLQTVRRTLSDGTSKVYLYPRLRYQGEDLDAIASLSTAYKRSAAWSKLSPTTKSLYQACLVRIGDLLVDGTGKPVRMSQMGQRGIRKLIYDAQDKMAARPASADMTIRVLSILLEWAVDRELLEFNPARKIKPLHSKASRADKFLSYDQQEELLAKADPDERAIITAALYTGLRMGDLCNVTGDYLSGGWLVLTPQKTKRLGIKVSIPVALCSPLEAVLEGAPRSGYILTRNGVKWHRKTLQDRWAKLRKDIAPDLHFHDLRGTLATRLSEAGCTDQESNAVLGKILVGGTLRDYVARTRRLAENAYTKLAKWEAENKAVKRAVDR